MWISRKYYNFLKENAEKNINMECQILTAKENQSRSVARAMEEYSAVLEERDQLRLRVIELEYLLSIQNEESIKNIKTAPILRQYDKILFTENENGAVNFIKNK